MAESPAAELNIDTAHLRRPDIKILPPTDPLYWADCPRIQHEWIKEVVPQINTMLPADRAYGVDKLLKGQIISMILSDDPNCFQSVSSPKKAFEKAVQDGVISIERLKSSQRKLIHRLNWEVGVAELDERVRVQIKEVLPFLESQAPWDTWENLRASYQQWRKVRQLTKRIINTKPKAKEAFRYYEQHLSQDGELKPLFDAFVSKAEANQEAAKP